MISQLAAALAALFLAHATAPAPAPAPLLSLGPVTQGEAQLLGPTGRATLPALVRAEAGDAVLLVQVEVAAGLGGPRLALAEGSPVEEHAIVALIPGLRPGQTPGVSAPGPLLPGEAQRLGQGAEGVWVARVDDDLTLHLDLHALGDDGLPERAAAQTQALGQAAGHDALPEVEWAGDLDADGAVDLLISLPGGDGAHTRRLLTSGAALPGELVGPRAVGAAGGC